MYNSILPEAHRYPRQGRKAKLPRGLKKYQMAGAALAGLASVAGGYYGKKRSSSSKVKSNRYGKGKVLKNQKNLKKQVGELKRLAESDMGTHIHRTRDISIVNTSVNAIEHGSWDLINLTKLEEVLALLQYYDPATPGTLVTASGLTGTYHKEFLFTRVSAKFLIRNNYQIPCKGTIYMVQCKNDTSITALTAFTNGLSDVGNPTSSSPLVFLTDSEEFKTAYKIISSKKFMLNPGDEASTFHSFDPFTYDPSFADSHSAAYQRKYPNLQVVVRLEGVLSHDTTTSERTTNQASCDVMYDCTYEVKYPAGVDIKMITIDNAGSTSFTNSGVCSQMPLADNQAYSKA